MPAFMSARPPARSSGQRQRGAAAVELAVILPVMMVLCLGVTELGRLIYTYNTLLKAVHSAARHVAMSQHLDADARSTARDEAHNLALYGDLARRSELVVPGLDPSMIRICDFDTSCSGHAEPSLNLVSVRISGYSYSSMFGLPLSASVPFNDISAIMRGRSS